MPPAAAAEYYWRVAGRIARRQRTVPSTTVAAPGRPRSALRIDVAALVLLGGAAAWFVWRRWYEAHTGHSLPSFDTYEVDYPIATYLARALREGHGLFWNRFQNCGEPFLASTTVGALYPPHALSLVLGFDVALLVVTGIHLLVAGAGVYLLCRVIGLAPAAALCGAIFFETDGETSGIAGWMPYSLLGAYALLPVAVACCERLLAAATPRRAVVLGVVLAVQLLPGHAQVSLFTYEVVALRVLWELLTRRVERRVRLLALVAVGLLLPVAVTAVQLLPRMEFASLSTRGRALTLEEIAPRGPVTWTALLDSIRVRFLQQMRFPVVPVALAGVGLLRALRHRVLLFYGVLAVLYLCLALDTPVQQLSFALPFGSLFRDPLRYLWVVAAALAILAAAGADTLIATTGRAWWRLAAVPVLFVLPAVFYQHAALVPAERLLLAALALVAAGAALSRYGRALALVALPALLLWQAFGLGTRPFLGYLADTSPIRRHHILMSVLQRSMSPQERVFQVGEHLDFSLQPRLGEIAGVPSILDYEHQTSRRYNELKTVLYDGRLTGSESQFAIRILPSLPRNRPLLSLLAVHYLLVDPATAAAVQYPPEPTFQFDPEVRVFRNARALPRAFFVPRAEVVAEPRDILVRLASDDHDPRRVALVESVPADGFLGGAGDATGTVEIESDVGETVTLQVEATDAGFLFISDQDYPGWEATVNGVRTPVLRANYAFRLVRVPAGTSKVVFRYRPASLRWGTGLSLATLAGLVAWCVATRRRATRFPAAPASE